LENNSSESPDENTVEPLNIPPENRGGLLGGKDFNKRQNIALAVVGVVGIGVVVLGFLQLNKILQVPLPTTGKEGQVVQSAPEAPQGPAEEDPEILKKQDTDGDGINDFDEYYVYETSIYLADSDSDGVSDFDEIMSNENPNCPKGQNCFRANEAPADSGGSDFSGSSSTTSTATGAGSAGALPVTDVSADDLRKVLSQTGQFSLQDLAEVDDQVLLDLYQQVLADNPDLAKMTIEPAANTTEDVVDDIASGVDTMDQAIQQMQTLSPAEIRKLMLEQGFDQATLDQVDDETLKILYEEALKEVSKGVE